jgi:hypothetical protein
MAHHRDEHLAECRRSLRFLPARPVRPAQKQSDRRDDDEHERRDDEQ